MGKMNRRIKMWLYNFWQDVKSDPVGFILELILLISGIVLVGLLILIAYGALMKEAITNGW